VLVAGALSDSVVNGFEFFSILESIVLWLDDECITDSGGGEGEREAVVIVWRLTHAPSITRAYTHVTRPGFDCKPTFRFNAQLKSNTC
jgi:hypothetical protein